MLFSRICILASLALSIQLCDSACSNKDSGACDFEPFNPVSCGANYECGYSNFCLAGENGYNVENDCCQAPQPSACTGEVDPQECGSKKCPYDNLCIASLAGYTASQCTPAPAECPVASDSCSGEPSNPIKCGPGMSCPYENFCLAKSAGYNTDIDCCQDVRQSGACQSNIAPVSCGRPGGKQCPYDNQCLADASGYNNKQCCKAVPEGTACTSDAAPVECGSIPCLYANKCEATAAGWTETDCCPQSKPGSVCTSEYKPVTCGTCGYSSQCLADAAGFSSTTCCAVPPEDTACAMDYKPVACGQASCVYDNHCIAEASGFDPNSCVAMPPTTGGTSATPEGTSLKSSACKASMGPIGAIASFLA